MIHRVDVGRDPNPKLLAVVCCLAVACTPRTEPMPADANDANDAMNDGSARVDSTAPFDAGPRDVARFDTSSGSDGGCTRPGFGSPAAWPLPRRALRVSEQGDATAAIALHTTLDLDGDERPDFVVTYDSARPVDESAWFVHRNNGSGFDATAASWPLPYRALRATEQGDARSALHLHSTFDLDGDLRPDFVVTFDRNTGTGDSEWLAYRNTGYAFDTAPIHWPIPRRAYHMVEQGDATAAIALWTTVDLDGDRRPEFVVTYDASATGTGTTWWVYRNTGAGFATTADAWTIPVRALRANEQGSATAAISLFALIDMDGDERPDFVRTYDASGDAGDGVWLVHRNNGSGFDATPIRWSVPGRTYHLAEQGDASAAARLFGVQPRVRRGPLDFFVTYDSSGTGNTEWLRNDNAGTGFATGTTTWSIPQRALRFDEQGDATGAFALHSTFDLDGDRVNDFVITYELNTEVGINEWRLARACAP